jgi:MoaD family protein
VNKTIKLFATLRDIAGAGQINVPFQEGETVRQMIENIRSVQPALAEAILDERGDLTGLVHVMVHGRNIQWLNGLDTTVRESDQIVLMPPSAGG